jgi:hypothetical protein
MRTAPADPKAKANAFLDALPGNSAISKTGWVTLAASLGGYAVSNELYVVNEESVILAGFVIMVGYLSSVIKEPYKQWADSVIDVSSPFHNHPSSLFSFSHSLSSLNASRKRPFRNKKVS